MSSRFIGSGSYSVVRRENLSGRPVAVKCVSESSLSTSRELKVLTSVKHKNVISFLGARQRDDGKLDIILPLGTKLLVFPYSHAASFCVLLLYCIFRQIMCLFSSIFPVWYMIMCFKSSS